MRNQFVFSIEDLRFVTILCRHCNTRVSLDLAAPPEFPNSRQQFETPRECPRCGRSFDSAIPGAISSLARAWKALEPLEDSVTFSGEAKAQRPDEASE